MATVDVTGNVGSTVTAGVSPNRSNNISIVVQEVRVTAAEAVAAKGSALAATDVIQVLDLPAETMVFGAGIEIETADSGTTLTLDLGYGSNVDVFADGVDATTAGYGAIGTNGKLNFDNAARFTATDTLDIVVATASAASDDWVARVYLFTADVSGRPVGGAAT